MTGFDGLFVLTDGIKLSPYAMMAPQEQDHNQIELLIPITNLMWTRFFLLSSPGLVVITKCTWIPFYIKEGHGLTSFIRRILIESP